MFHGAYAILPLVASGLALLCVLFWIVNRNSRWWMGREDGAFLLALLVFAAVWLGDVWRTGVWPVGVGNQGVRLPLLPVLVLMAWRQEPPQAGFWWWGVACGGAVDPDKAWAGVKGGWRSSVMRG